MKENTFSKNKDKKTNRPTYFQFIKNLWSPGYLKDYTFFYK